MSLRYNYSFIPPGTFFSSHRQCEEKSQVDWFWFTNSYAFWNFNYIFKIWNLEQKEINQLYQGGEKRLTSLALRTIKRASGKHKTGRWPPCTRHTTVFCLISSEVLYHKIAKKFPSNEGLYFVKRYTGSTSSYTER